MTATEKANELLDKFNLKTGLMSIERKQCALIAVDEIIETFPKQWNGFEHESCDDYWQEVKQELLKL
jgi:hypothetical protein